MFSSKGTPNDPNPDKAFAKLEHLPLFSEKGFLNPSATILGMVDFIVEVCYQRFFSSYCP